MPAQMNLLTSDGVRIAAYHDPGPGPVVFVVAHGFTGSANTSGLRAVRTGLGEYGGVLAIDLRGHGKSGGVSTVGDLEVHDLSAAVALARELGYRDVVTVGFSMGASIVVRHAALAGDAIAAVVSVSGPAFWHYRGTSPMRLVHHTIGKSVGRALARVLRGTRIAPTGWDPEPEAPVAVAARIAPIPFLVVHGDQDTFFPLEHPQRLAEAATANPAHQCEMWIEPGFGHAESSISPDLIRRIGLWALANVGNRARPEVVGEFMEQS